MKSFCQNLIFLSLFSGIIKIFLPKGEKSPLYAPLNFLLSLCMILCIFSPLYSFIKGDFKLPSLSIITDTKNIQTGEEIVLTRMEETMTEHIKSQYAETDFSLLIYRDESHIPTGIGVLCEDESKGQDIADYIKLKYALEAKIIQR